MTDTAGIHFGPAWLRNTFVQPPQGGEQGQGGPGGGGGTKSGSGSGSENSIMAPAKLAEFRYGREEMLALFEMPVNHLPLEQCKVIQTRGLWGPDHPRYPLNLMGPMSEEEQRAWSRGANSDTSMRLYKKEIPSGSMTSGPGIGRGGHPNERGRGRGRGFFDRHRGPPDDDDGIGRREEGGRPFGGRGGARSFDRSISDRGNWFDRSNSTSGGGQPGEEGGGPPNGSISPRKNYSRAPYDDWRKPASATSGGDQEEEGQGGGGGDRGGWRSGPSSSGRRWNAPPGSEGGRGGGGTGGNPGGWRTVPGEREYHNGSNSRWHRETTGEDTGYGSRRGGFNASNRGFHRTRSRQDSDIPEWANEDVSEASKSSGGFDSSGKFSSDLDKPRHVIHLNRDLNSSNAENNQLNLHPEPEDDQAFEDEEVDIDDLPQELRGNHMENNKTKIKPITNTAKKAVDGGVVVEPKTNDKVLENSSSSPWNSTTTTTRTTEPIPSSAAAEKTTTNHSEDLRHEAIADDFVSKLIEEDDSAAMVVKTEPPISSQQHLQPQVQPQQQQLQQPQQPSPQPSPQHHQPPPQEQIPSVQQIQWFYLDPKRNEQGPFSSSDMLEWCEAGYFPADLMLRRAGIDQRFTRLNEMTRMYGRVPFTPGPAPGPLLQENQQQQQPPQQQQQQPHQQQQQSHQTSQPINQVQPNAGSTPTPPLNSSTSPSNLNNTQAILQQIQQQQLYREQLLRQQQQLYAIQQQPHLSEMEKAQLINKIMQLSILPTSSSTSLPAQQSIHQPKPPTDAMPHSSDIGMLLKQQQQQQQQSQQQHQQQQQQFGGLQRPVDMMPQMIPSTAESSGLQLLGSCIKSPNTSSSANAITEAAADLQNPPFNPIKSLLSQLQQQQQQEDLRQPPNANVEVGNSNAYSPYQDQSPSPPPLAHQSPQVPPRSIWNNHHHNQNPENVVQDSVIRSTNNTKIDQWGSSREENFRENDFTKKIEEPNSFYNHVQHQRELGSSSNNSSGQIQPQHFTEKSVIDNNTNTNIITTAGVDDFLVDNLVDDESSNGFVKPKSSEKKEKKSKRAEEKKKSREKENNSSSRGREYIPGMEGSVRPMDEDDDLEQTQEFYEEDQVRMNEHEKSAQQQQQTATFQPKLAPWAKMTENTTSNTIQSNNMSLAEIQKLEEEREREAKIRRDFQEAAQARARQEEEEVRRQQIVAMNWANSSSNNGGAQKSLAEIQAEEQRQDRERQERERREKKARQKDLSLSQASVWGSASANLSWASKAAPVTAPAMVTTTSGSTSGGGGFWDEPPTISRKNEPQNLTPQPSPLLQHHSPQPQQQQQQSKKTKKNNKAKEESKVAAIFKESKGKPSNEFDEWCTNALDKLNPQVDIPTFMSFLNDVESPYEVNDYVKNYIGDGKGPKNFAKEYVERRSKYRNSLKSVKKSEDDLLTPAVAINPNEPDEFVPVLGGGGAGGGKKNKKKNKSKSKLDASHLLGFSVSSSERPNAGELDYVTQ